MRSENRKINQAAGKIRGAAGVVFAELGKTFWFEAAAVLHLLGLNRILYGNLRFSRSRVFALRRFLRAFGWVGTFGRLAKFGFKLLAAGLTAVIIVVPMFQAYEAHVLNVTAEPVQIDPPVLTIPGDTGWDNLSGGSNLTGQQDIIMSDSDPDATHIFYTFGPGTDPSLVPDPICGGGSPDNGGGDKTLPQHLAINADTVIKAIACDGPGAGAHFSLINTKIYTFLVPCQDRFVPLDVMIIFDRSGSMLQDDKLSGAKSAAEHFVSNLNPDRDQVGLVDFSSTAELNHTLTSNFAAVNSAIDSLSANGATDIGDAIDKANIELHSIRARSNSTKVEILLTDGRANRPGSGDDNAQATALAIEKATDAANSGFLLYTIGLGADVNADFLTQLAQMTGGEYFASDLAANLDNVYSQISHLLCGSGKISGYKFEDKNSDGQWQYDDQNQNGRWDPGESGEPGVAGWIITLKKGSAIFATATTDQNGYYEFTELPAGVNFTLAEQSRFGWTPTNPASGKYDNVTLAFAGQVLENQNFGNFAAQMACMPKDANFPENLAAMAAGDNTGNDSLLMAANTLINGSAHSNADIAATNPSPSRMINGDVSASGNVDPNITVTGTSSNSAAAQSLPDINQTFWKAQAQAGGIVNGSLVFPVNTSGVDLGPSEILGNVVFGSNNSATLKGPLYIHGNLVLNSNTKIYQDSAFGGSFSIIIVDGTIDIDSNAQFLGQSGGAVLLVSNAGAKTGSNAAIEAAANGNMRDVVLYASSGDIHLNANRVVLGVFAAHGTSLSDPAIRLDSNTIVEFGHLPGQIACGPEISPGNDLKKVVINEFMPNPSGSDNAPGPMGEWVELYNGGTAAQNVEGWVLTDSFGPAAGAKSKLWTSAADFSAGITTDTYIESGGNHRVRVSDGKTSGTFEMVFDAGEGKKGDWQDLSWHESLSAGADICLSAATSDDGMSYSAYSPEACGSPLDLSPLPDSRFLKFKSRQARSSGSHADNADLLDATLDYNLLAYHELVIGVGNVLGNLNMAPGDRLVVYRDSSLDFDLNNSADSVNLYDGHPLFGGSLRDSHVYNYGVSIPDNKSFTRMPDGTANWVDPEATPGQPNDEFVTQSISPTPEIVYTGLPENEVLEPAPVAPSESDFVGTSTVNAEPAINGNSNSEILSDSTTTIETNQSPVDGDQTATSSAASAGDEINNEEPTSAPTTASDNAGSSTDSEVSDPTTTPAETTTPAPATTPTPTQVPEPTSAPPDSGKPVKPKDSESIQLTPSTEPQSPTVDVPTDQNPPAE